MAKYVSSASVTAGVMRQSTIFFHITLRSFIEGNRRLPSSSSTICFTK